MMTSEEKIKIGVEVAGNAPDVLESLRNSIRGLERDLKRLKGITIPNSVGRRKGTPGSEGDTGAQAGSQIRFDRIALRGFREKMILSGRMAAQRVREERVAARVKQAVAAETVRAARIEAQVTRQTGATAMRDLRSRMSFQARMRRQKEAEEDAAARVEARRVRDQARHHKYLFGLRLRHEREIAAERQKVTRSVFDSFGGMRSSASQVRQSLSSPAKVAAAGGLVAAGAVRTGIGSRMTTDTAETNLRMFGGEGAAMMTQAQVKQIREGWLDREALKNGMNVPAALNAYTEVLKAGIDKSQAADVTKEILKATAGMDLNVPLTTKLVGRLAQLTKGGPAEIGGMLNSMGIVAAETAADTDELVSSLRRGAGALANKNLKVSDLTAFTGVGISAGIQEGMAGTFIEHQQRDLLNAKYARGQEAKDLNKAFAVLGMGSRGSVSMQTAQDPAETLEKLYTKLGELADKNPVKAFEAATKIGGQEWGGKMLMMAQSAHKIRSTRQAANDPNNKDFLATLKGERLGSWAGMWNTTKATFQLFWEKFGAGFDGILRDVTTYFADIGQRFDWNRVTLHVQAFLDGVKEGFGVRTWRELIDNITGSIGAGDMVTKLKDFGRGIAQGVTSFVDAIKAIGSSIGFDGKQSAEDMGKLVAQITLLSASLIVLAPVVSVLSLLAGGINLIVSALTAARGLLALLGIGTGAGSAVAAGGAAGAVAAGGVGTLAYLIGKYFTSNLPDFNKRGADGIRDDQSKGVMGTLWQWMTGRDNRQEPASKALSDLPPEIQRLNEEIDLLREQLDSNAKVQKQSFDASPSLRSMIQTASLSNISDRMGGLVQKASLSKEQKMAGLVESFNQQEQQRRNRASGSFSTGTSTGGLLGNQTPGEALGNVGIGRRGIIGGGAGGSASSNPANSAASVRMLDAIAGTESGRAGYDAVLGNGRYGTPTKPVSKMSIDEAFAFGRQVLARHGSSSALGRYQIVGKTMRTAQRALGVSGEALFDGPMQDRMARWVARNQGLGAWEGLKHNPAAMAQARAALAEGGARDQAPGASIGTSMKEAAAGWRHPLDGAGRLSSAFGMRRHPISGAFKMHNGLDLAAPAGTAVKAMRDGVVSIGRSGDVTLKHPDGSSTTYRHVSAGVAPGQSVAAGEIIARLRANDPRSTGPHLHLESRDAAGLLRDPQGILSASTRKVVDDYKSSGWKPGPGGNARAIDGASRASLPSARMDPETATRNVPVNPLNSGEVGRRLDAGTPGGGGGGAGAPQIHINGFNGDPEALANAVQRRLSDRMGRRTHEVEHHWG